MLEKVLFVLSFGERYVVASVTYLGLALVLFSTMHEDKNVYAQNGSTGCTHEITVTDEEGTHQETVPGCDEGQQCCGTSCISSTDICCEDETSGSANSCTCCTPSSGGSSSISCQ